MEKLEFESTVDDASGANDTRNMLAREFGIKAAFARVDQSGKNPRERRLSRSVVAHHEHRFAPLDAQVHIRERSVGPRRAR